MSTARTRRPFTRLASVAFDEYDRYRRAPGNRGLRMAYHDGVLEIMSPEFRHDRGARHLLFLVAAYCQAFEIPCSPAGSTTFAKGQPGQRKGQGKEPDESFYVGDAVAAIRGKETLDLEVDPPPSLWIEVDNWGSSQARLPLYAGLGVPEVWRYRARRRTLWFGRLAGGRYKEVAASGALPGLTPAHVLEMLDEVTRTGDLTAWTRWLDDVWFPRHRQELLDAGAPG
jgi:Uma2 family endonuclease